MKLNSNVASVRNKAVKPGLTKTAKYLKPSARGGKAVGKTALGLSGPVEAAGFSVGRKV